MTTEVETTKRREIRLDPQRIAFLNYYANPESETFNNALRSAIKAGYSESYAARITTDGEYWISEHLREFSIIHKAERNLNTMLDGDDERIKADLTKFALERLKKHKYSSRQEHTGSEGEPLFLPSTLLNKNALDKPIIEATIIESSNSEA